MKAECPACKAYLSGVWDALEGRRDGCPSCGLDAETMQQVMRARKALADKELTERCEQALIRAGRAEKELSRLRARVYAVRAAFADWEREDPLSSERWQGAARGMRDDD
jgi:hypothetical protein